VAIFQPVAKHLTFQCSQLCDLLVYLCFSFNMLHGLPVHIILLASKVDLLLHSLDRLISKRLVLEHCVYKSAINSLLPSPVPAVGLGV
jgi:hypothetical protein